MGSTNQLIIKVPTAGATGWATVMRTDTFQKIAEHTHQGAGTGSLLNTEAINVDQIDNTLIRLDNDAYMRSRNAADDGDINIIKIGSDDKIALGATVLAMTADATSVTTTNTSLIDTLATAVTLADAQTVITTGIVTLGTDESCAVHYRIVRNGVTQSGVLRFTDVETIPSEIYSGTDVGVTFTVSSGSLFYATTSTGFTGSMTYVVIKE